MIRDFDTSLTYKGVDYDILIQGNDIILQSLEKDILLKDAAFDLREDCEKYLKGCSFENGRPVSPTSGMIDEEFNRVLAQYAYDNAGEGLILNHNLN